MEEKSNTQSHLVRGIEIFGHAIGGVGQNMVYALWSGFITAFYTDIFGMNPAVMATIFVVARVWDAFNDPNIRSEDIETGPEVNTEDTVAGY